MHVSNCRNYRIGFLARAADRFKVPTLLLTVPTRISDFVTTGFGDKPIGIVLTEKARGRK